MRKLILSAAALGAGLWLGAAATPAAAQVPVPPPINYSAGIQSIRNTQMLTLRQMVDRNAVRNTRHNSRGGTTANGSGKGGGAPRGGGGGGVSAHPAAGPTTFRPVAPMLVPRQLAATTPDKRAEAEKFYVEMLEGYGEILRRKGLPQNDVARAASFAVIVSHDVLKGSDLTEAQVEGVRRQMRRVFAEDEEFQRMGDRAKQELYESYAIIGMMISSLYDGAVRANHRQGVEQLRRMSRVQLEEAFGVPVEQLSFTNDGVKKNR